MRQGAADITESTVTFNLSGVELWGGQDETTDIDSVTVDGKDITVTNSEPGMQFNVSFPRSSCLIDGKPIFCHGSQKPHFSYWPFNNHSNSQVDLTLSSYDTTSVLASDRMSLVMIMNRPQGGKSIQSISFACE
jgi:hypothetical protein